MNSSPTQFSRRQFIQITASAGLFLAGGAGIASTLAAARQPHKVQQTRLLLGSLANITVVGVEPERANAAILAAFERMEALESVLSRFQDHSQVSQLNATGAVGNAHPAFLEVMQRAVDYGQLTGGAFDVTVEPVLRLYRDSTHSGQLPDATALAETRRLVDYRQIEIADGHIRLGQPGMAVSLDGIAKGYVIDQGAQALREHGLDQLMVELGGDLRTVGQANTRPWRIGITQADSTRDTSLVAHLTSGALATSGDYLNTYASDRRLHHIIDPARGISPLELASASVIAPTTCAADALSTALLVMGSPGLTLIEQLPDTEALVIAKNGDLTRTAQFPVTV
ncbi:MAG: FAD:protein FMN transferase [Anaerolineae bacterium]|nr:FAD:protein FMN transferase [Anaerolineae bacterium]